MYFWANKNTSIRNRVQQYVRMHEKYRLFLYEHMRFY